MKQKAILWPGCLFLVLFMATECRNDKYGRQSNITTDIRIERFEQDLFSTDPTKMDSLIPQWKDRYGVFFNHYCGITAIGDPADAGFNDRMQAFATDWHNYRLYKRTMEVFPDLTNLTLQLNSAFSNFRDHFSGITVPHVYTFISGFSRSAITDDSLLAIGLDRYLGTTEPLYREAGIYGYLTQNMHPAKIPSDCMNFWIETEFPFNDSVNSLIANMIYQGRSLFLTKAMLPEQPDTLTLGFSAEDLDYMEEYEKSMWAFLVDQKLLFNTDRFTINKFVLEGPFTTDFGSQSPARAAVWIGYRITASYMNRNKNTDLNDLMHESDYLKILNGSGYNP